MRRVRYCKTNYNALGLKLRFDDIANEFTDCNNYRKRNLKKLACPYLDGVDCHSVWHHLYDR